MRKKKAFTLIELLVVIAIIALLLSILLPSLKKVKQVARDAICRSNIKQWGLIWQVYTSESDGKLPDCTGFGGLRGDWIVALREDYPTGKITSCPTANKKFVDYANPNHDHGGIYTPYRNKSSNGIDGYEYCSYGMNNWSYSTGHWAMGANNGASKLWGRFEVGGASRDTIPLFMDSAFRGSFPSYGGYDNMNMVASEEPQPHNGFGRVMDGIRQFALPRHGSGGKVGTNVVFFDMSVRHVMVKEMWSLKWHREFETNEWRTQRATIWPGDGTGNTWLDRLSEEF